MINALPILVMTFALLDKNVLHHKWLENKCQVVITFFQHCSHNDVVILKCLRGNNGHNFYFEYIVHWSYHPILYIVHQFLLVHRPSFENLWYIYIVGKHEANILFTYYIYRESMFPIRILGNRVVLISSKIFKKCSTFRGKLDPKSLTKVAIQTAYYHFFCLSTATMTYKNRNIHTKHKQELGRLHQTIISFAKSELSHLIRLPQTSVFPFQVHHCILRQCRGQSAQNSSQWWFGQLLQIVQLHNGTHNLPPLEFYKHLNCPA